MRRKIGVGITFCILQLAIDVFAETHRNTHMHAHGERERWKQRDTHTERILLYGVVRGIYEKFSRTVEALRGLSVALGVFSSPLTYAALQVRLPWLLCCLRTLVSNKAIALVFIFPVKLKRLTWHCEKPVFFCFILNKS